MRHFGLVCLLAAFPLAAEEAIIETEESENRDEYTLLEISQRVRSHSELIQAQKLKIQSTEAQGRQATAWQNPLVTAELGRLKDTQNNNMTYDFRVTQPIYFPGKMGKQLEVYEREAEIQRIEGEDLSESLSLEAAYYAYQFSIAELRSSQINNRIKRMSLMRTYMRAQAFASPAKIIQRNIVNNQLVALQRSLNTSMAEVESSWQKLNVYLNQKEKVRVITPWLVDLRDIDQTDFVNKVRAGNRRLKAKKVLLSRIEAEVSYAKRVPLPDVSISAFYRREALETPGANQFYGGAVTVPIPVLNANRAGVEAAEKRLEAARAEEKYAQREVLQLARAAHAEYMQKKKLFDDFKAEQIPALEKQMLFADRELKLGRIDLISYLELELKTHEALSSYYDTQLEIVKVIAQMIYLMGDSAVYQGDLYVFQNY
jgi:outer membrane protein, heavy metal efflux system